MSPVKSIEGKFFLVAFGIEFLERATTFINGNFLSWQALRSYSLANIKFLPDNKFVLLIISAQKTINTHDGQYRYLG